MSTVRHWLSHWQMTVLHCIKHKHSLECNDKMSRGRYMSHQNKGWMIQWRMLPPCLFSHSDRHIGIRPLSKSMWKQPMECIQHAHKHASRVRGKRGTGQDVCRGLDQLNNIIAAALSRYKMTSRIEECNHWCLRQTRRRITSDERLQAQRHCTLGCSLCTLPFWTEHECPADSISHGWTHYLTTLRWQSVGSPCDHPQRTSETCACRLSVVPGFGPTTL